MATRHFLAPLSELSRERGTEFVIGPRIIAVFVTPEGVQAIDGICPHAGGPLAQGMLRNNVVTCPWHGWQFNVCTGQHCLNPRLTVTHYPVIVDETGVSVELP